MDTCKNHLITRNLSNLIVGDFNGHNYMWGSHDADTQGEVIERFTDKHNLCILNDGTHTYLKPQAQHVNRPMSAIDLTISTPGLALKCVGGPARYPWHWPLSHSDFDLTISSRDTAKLRPFPLGIFLIGWLGTVPWPVIGKDHWGHPKGRGSLHSFVKHITKAANDSIPRATTIPKKSNLWFDEEWLDDLKARRALDKRVRQSREFRW